MKLTHRIFTLIVGAQILIGTQAFANLEHGSEKRHKGESFQPHYCSVLQFDGKTSLELRRRGRVCSDVASTVSSAIQDAAPSLTQEEILEEVKKIQFFYSISNEYFHESTRRP